MSLQQREAALYSEVFSSVADYTKFSPGEKYAEMFAKQTLEYGLPSRWTVLDAGCGSGKGALALQKLGFEVQLCDFTSDGLIPEAKAIDFTQVCLWDDVRNAVGRLTDFVYCTDVLEHIPPQFTMLVVQRLLSCAKLGLFLSISTTPDNFGVWVGKHLHQTVQPFMWWKENLAEIGRITDARDLLNNAVFFVEPR